jgi:hypothetical protein
MDLGSLYANAIQGSSSLADVILLSPDDKIGILPMDSVGQGGYFFHLPTEETVTFTSDVTDHYIEDNTSMQDHVAMKPRIVTTGGYIGELNNVTPKLLAPLKEVLNRLGTVTAYVPVLAVASQRAYNTAEQTYRAFLKAQRAFLMATGTDSVKKELMQTEQQKAYKQFYDWWKARTLFKVQTPYEAIENMVIMSLRVTQSESDKNSSMFELTFKEIRTAKSVFSLDNNLGRLATQKV